MNFSSKKKLWEKQNEAFRDPVEIISQKYEDSGLSSKSLLYQASNGFIDILQKNNLTLLITREQEHLCIALTVKEGKLIQSFIHIPHPCGLVVDRKSHCVYVVSTRNPNQVWEFKPIKSLFDRIDQKIPKNSPFFLMPSRIKYFSGACYMHDLALINGELYANSVGQNGIVKISFDTSKTDELVWWPKCIEDKLHQPTKNANFLQLNSIAAGNSLENSFFSASSSYISRRRPGHLNYPVNKKGVIFSGATREVIATGLTRPHSARLYKNRLWVDNSGYGEIGFIQEGKFQPILKLPGWTRGLCIVKGVMFVGVSRILPRFYMYAPGLSKNNQTCGIFAIEEKTGRVLGKLIWPFGNQIFSIDWIDNKVTPGFMFEKIKKSTEFQKMIFYSYQL